MTRSLFVLLILPALAPAIQASEAKTKGRQRGHARVAKMTNWRVAAR
jgi:hypothetical protein